MFLIQFGLLLLLTTLSNCSEASQRLCEVQGTCFKCQDGHFSHFLCRSDVDCFAGEFCVTARGFCCPGVAKDLNRTTSLSALCPDGSSWGRMCKTDGDCLFRDELCAEGKCCPSCRQRRLQALRELRSFGSVAGRTSEEFIPQCSDDGKHFRPMQCTGLSGECFCVDKFGRHQRRHHHHHQIVRKARPEQSGHEQLLNCSILREEEDRQNSSLNDREAPKVALSRDRWVTELDQPKEGKEEGGEERCTDPLREYRHCGSTCPISCATRTLPRCPQEQCMRGCFCRLPYVILDAADPFGSRCVLPAECPLLPFTPELDQWRGGFFPANQPPSSSKRAEKCRDHLKNYQSCGSACPAGCGQLAAPLDCSSSCVPGCFCRIPYVLQNPLDPSSECVLPQQCPPSAPTRPQLPTLLSAASEAQLCLPERNQSWTGCFSRKCSRSCGEWPPFCVPDDCLAGCECQPPAVVRDKAAPVWECVMPEDCPRVVKGKLKGKEEEKCEDPHKEYLKCGSSCPLGCDRLDQPLRQCSPCASGCFCKNGFVFVNASNWRHSGCVPLAECSARKEEQPTNSNQQTILLPASATTITAIQRLDTVEVWPICPANGLDRDGMFCQDDLDCGGQRKCCSSNGTAPPRCTCRDPNAIWTECGPLCPEFCAQTAARLCPGPCRSGCFCPPGFVKRTDDPHAECVPIAQCAVSGEESIDSDTVGRVGKEEKECGEALASASLYARDGQRIGRLVVRPERANSSSSGASSTHRIRLSGEFSPAGLSPGAQLLLSIHQFSDTTINGCAGVGHALQLRLLDNHVHGIAPSVVEELAATRKEDGTANANTFGLDQRIEWPDPIVHGTNPLIGHSVVLQQAKGRTAGEDEEHRAILGCAVLGIAPSC